MEHTLVEPMDIYALTGASAHRTRLQAAAARRLTRFVGRDAEIEQIRRALVLAHDGHGQLVAIVGEPGVRKSRRVVYSYKRCLRKPGAPSRKSPLTRGSN
jgi:hypothetical protein